MPAPGQAAGLLFAIGVCTGLTACGGSINNNAVVVRVGDHAFTKATVDHWTNVIKRGGAFSGFRGAPPHGTARQRAVTLLITSDWLIDEATHQGVAAPETTVDQALVEREQNAEFRRNLSATGQTTADVELEMKAELAGEAIREKLAGSAAHFTQRELVDFYHENGRLFSGLEVRVTDLIENEPSASAAVALVRRIGTGRRFAKMAIREQVSRTPGFMATPEKTKVVNAIFTARPGVVSQPMLLNHGWAVFVVRKIIPPQVQPLARVRAEVAARLNVTRQHQVASTFDREYTSRWRARTGCRTGYVAPGCPQSTGLLERYEDPFSRRAHPLLSEGALAG